MGFMGAELSLQQHGVHGGAVGGLLVSQQLAQVLLVQAGVEQVGVRVRGRGLGRTNREGGAHPSAPPISLISCHRRLSLRLGRSVLVVVLADEGGDVKAPEGLLLCLGGAGAELLLPGRGVRGPGGRDAATATETLLFKLDDLITRLAHINVILMTAVMVVGELLNLLRLVIGLMIVGLNGIPWTTELLPFKSLRPTGVPK